MPLRVNMAGGGPVGGVRKDSPRARRSPQWREVVAQFALGTRSRAAPASLFPGNGPPFGEVSMPDRVSAAAVAGNRQGAGRRLRPCQSAGGQRHDDRRLARLGGDDDRGRAGGRGGDRAAQGSGLVRPQAWCGHEVVGRRQLRSAPRLCRHRPSSRGPRSSHCVCARARRRSSRGPGRRRRTVISFLHSA